MKMYSSGPATGHGVARAAHPPMPWWVYRRHDRRRLEIALRLSLRTVKAESQTGG